MIAGMSTHALRDTLFGDISIELWPEGDAGEYPWSAFAEARTLGGSEAIARWKQVAADAQVESRHRLQAWHFLRGVGVDPTPDEEKQLLGVVIEVAMPEGLDLLAAYADFSARYFNYSGAGVIWDRPDSSLDGEIAALFRESSNVLAQIGPWDGDRPPAPEGDAARLCFLTPSGLHFGQAPIGVLMNDAMAGPVLQAAIQLMTALIEKSQAG